MPQMVIDLLRLVLWLVVLAAIFVPLERLVALRPQRVFRRAVATDLGYYFLSSLLPGVVLGVPLAIVARAAHAAMPDAALAAVAALPVWARLLAGLLVGEIGFYWGHRWTHTVPLLWRFHSVHHAAEEMDFLVNTRAHPVDLMFVRLCGLVPLYALGLGGPMGGGESAVPVAVVLIGTVWGFFIHANLRVRLGPLEWLVATPAFHHWHHTRAGNVGANFAATLPALDRLFGTHHLPRRWPDAYGVEARTPATLAGQLAAPFKRQGS